MKATTVQEAIDALEGGKGPVELTQSLARELAAVRPQFFDGWSAEQRRAHFGPAPYSGSQFGAFELRIVPDPDTPSRAESKARGRFDKQIGEAREREQIAVLAYEVAEKGFLNALGRLIAIEGSSGRAIVTTIDRQPMPQSRADVTTHNAARAAEAETRAAWDEAGDVLHKARVKLSALERRADDAARRVRLEN